MVLSATKMPVFRGMRPLAASKRAPPVRSGGTSLPLLTISISHSLLTVKCIHALADRLAAFIPARRIRVRDSSNVVLEVRNLETAFITPAGIARAVDDVSFSVRENEILAIIGESGSGKTVTALTLL